MRIRLQNFKNHSDQTFEFEDQGLSLLIGKSGSGKTSIVQAIYFALFGHGYKVVSFGKTSCSVELELDGLSIKRTKRPNRLTVNDIHEDKVAQDIINKKFGNTFETTGYISQSSLNSFVLMSPIDKLSFLEKFAFKDIDLAVIKNRCKALIGERHIKLTSVISQLEMGQQVLSEIKLPEEVKFPIKCSLKQQERVTNMQNIKLKNCNIRINKCRRYIKSIHHELCNVKILRSSVNMKKTELTSIANKINILEKEIQTTHYIGSEKLEKYTNHLNTLLTNKKLNHLQSKYQEDLTSLEEMKTQELEKTTLELNKINSDIWKEYSPDELNTTIKDCNSTIKDLEKVKDLKQDLSNSGDALDTPSIDNKKNKLIESRQDLDSKRQLYEQLKIRQEIYSCPSCNTKLRFNKDKLCTADNIPDIEETNINIVKENITSLTTLIKHLEITIHKEQNKQDKKLHLEEQIKTILSQYEDSNLQETIDDLEYLKEYKLSQNELEKKKKYLKQKIENEHFSTSYSTFKKNVEKQLNTITNIENIENHETSYENDIVICEEELRTLVSTQKNNKEKINNIKRQINTLEKEQQNYKYNIETETKTHTDKYKSVRESITLENLVKENEEQIASQSQQTEKHQQNIDKISSYKQYKDNIDNYTTWKDKITNLQQEEKLSRDKYTAATLLKDKILEAESISMRNIINSINTHAQIYLDCFFVEDPISVKLLSFKQSKKTIKPQINLCIDYKDMECDFNMLSGGEKARVVLSYTLALSEMFNTPIILLDECTASLDQAYTSVVFNGIRENLSDKLVLVIAHQIVEGSFDKVVNLNI